METLLNGIPENPGARPSRVKLALFNPFHYVAGGPALTLGLVLIVLAGLVGALGNTHFDGVLDLHPGPKAPLWFFIAEGVIDWLALALPLALAGWLLAPGRGVRMLDVIGTQALARTPYLMAAAAVLLPGFQRTLGRLMESLPAIMQMQQAAATSGGAVKPDPAMMAQAMAPLTQYPADMAVFVFVSMLVMIMLVWMVTLMYQAYAVSCHVKGARAGVSFPVAVIVGEIVSKVALGLLASAGGLS